MPSLLSRIFDLVFGLQTLWWITRQTDSAVGNGSLSTQVFLAYFDDVACLRGGEIQGNSGENVLV